MSSRLHETYHLEEPESGRSQGRNYTLLLYIALAMAFFFVTRPSIHGNDGVQNYAYLRSMMFDGDLNFANEYEYFMSRQADWFDRKQIPRDPVTNLPINLYGVGNSILWAPWVGIAHAVGKLVNAMGGSLELNGYTKPYAMGVSFGSCFYATTALVLLFQFLRKIKGAPAAAWAIFLVWLASPLFFYMYLHPSMSHANSFFLTTLIFLLYVKMTGWGETPAVDNADEPLIEPLYLWALLGLCSGLLVITRYQDGILLLALLVGELWRLKNATQPRTRWMLKQIPRYALWVLGFMLMLIPQVLAWGYLQGSYFSGPRAYIHQGNFSLLAPAYAPQVLFSSNHGVFYWHPALLIAAAGLATAGSFHRLKLMSLSAFAGQVWVTASWSIWWGGASFGHRMFISTLPFLALGALFTVGKNTRLGTVLKGLLLLLILWNFGCIVQYGLGWIPRQEGVSYLVLGYNNFVRLPMLLLNRVF